MRVYVCELRVVEWMCVCLCVVVAFMRVQRTALFERALESAADRLAPIRALKFSFRHWAASASILLSVLKSCPALHMLELHSSPHFAESPQLVLDSMQAWPAPGAFPSAALGSSFANLRRLHCPLTGDALEAVRSGGAGVRVRACV